VIVQRTTEPRYTETICILHTQPRANRPLKRLSFLASISRGFLHRPSGRRSRITSAARAPACLSRPDSREQSEKAAVRLSGGGEWQTNRLGYGRRPEGGRRACAESEQWALRAVARCLVIHILTVHTAIAVLRGVAVRLRLSDMLEHDRCGGDHPLFEGGKFGVGHVAEPFRDRIGGKMLE
jgi:hypothetical protein